MSTKSLIAIFTFGFCLSYSQNTPYTFLNGTQKHTPIEKHGINKTTIDTKSGEIINVQTLRDGKTTVNKIDLTEMVDIIVEMKDKPLFIQQHETSGPILQKSAYINRLMQFRSDLGTLHQSSVSSLRTILGAPVIKREFHKIFFGAAVRIPRAMISQIASLNYVKKVHVDVQVKALLDQSVHQIHADSVWTKLGIQGDSVVVGILDTGIDYLDIAFGGGFGPAFKVIGGYDIINNDGDPMDDNGHGTHVAGIVAANSDSLKGVAPHAKLMAFKVLDNNGSGSESEVLAGIERAADPNDDGNSNDMVDVVNMSLGGHGTPDDALSIAVDNAVKLGITFCIAAGNSYDFYTIGSPGTARLAITVGSVDSIDNISSFSSRGPNSLIYSIKPEIVAPGENILSTLLNNTTGQRSGTSMAAPHVAGVCALLKSLHRNWTPAQIKSAVMTTAIDLGQEVMTQGAGRIDALKASEVSTLVVPSQLSFGLAGFTPIWTVIDTLWVSNQFSQSQSFNMSFDNLTPGIFIDATPSSFSLAHNDSQQVLVRLSVNNSQVAYPTRGSLAYSGNAYIYGTKDTLRIPWAFIKAAKVSLAFNQPNTQFFLTNSSSYTNSYNASWPDSNHAEVIVPAGIYDLLVVFLSYPTNFVFREGLNINTAENLSVSSTEAIYSVKLQGIDQNCQPIFTNPYTTNYFEYLFAFPDSSRLGDFLLGTPADSILVSGFSNRLKIICGGYYIQPPSNIYNINFNPVQGLQANISLSNQPSEFRSQNLSAEFPPQSEYQGINIMLWTKYVSIYGYFYFGIYFGPNDLITGFTGKWNGKLFFNVGKDSLYSFPISLLAFDQSRLTSTVEPWFLSAPFTVVNDSIGMFFGSRPPASLYLSPDNGSIILGSGLNYTDVNPYNNVFGKSNIAVFPYFYGALDEEKRTSPYRSHYTIYNSNDAVIASDTLTNIQPIDVPAGEYRFEVKHQDYYIRGMQGRATLTTRFDLRKSDPNPPRFTSLMLLDSKGFASDSFSVGEHATLVFSIEDNHFKNYASINSDSVKLFYKMNENTEWIPLPVTLWMTDTANNTPRGLVFKTGLTNATQFDSSVIDLKLEIQDQSGNSTEWSLEPAFGIGKFTTMDVVEKKSNELTIPGKFALRQNYPNPFNPITTIEFDIPHNSFVTLDIFNLLGQKVATVLAKELQAGTYKIPWNANNVSSGVYFYRLNARSFVDTKKLLLLK